MILSSLKKSAEAYLNGQVSMAVVAVPDSFVFPLCLIIAEACVRTDFDIMPIITDTSATGLAYTLDRPSQDEPNILFSIQAAGTWTFPS